MTQISKKDWKLYREKLPQWQERYMEGLIQEYIDFLVEVRKSTAIDIILRMIKLKVISKDDLNDFSSELKQEIERRIAFYR